MASVHLYTWRGYSRLAQGDIRGTVAVGILSAEEDVRLEHFSEQTIAERS